APISQASGMPSVRSSARGERFVLTASCSLAEEAAIASVIPFTSWQICEPNQSCLSILCCCNSGNRDLESVNNFALGTVSLLEVPSCCRCLGDNAKYPTILWLSARDTVAQSMLRALRRRRLIRSLRCVFSNEAVSGQWEHFRTRSTK